MNNKILHKMKRVFLTLIVCFFSLMSVKATVVDPRPVEVKQSDGKTVTVTPHGDERVAWYRTTDGYTLMIAPNHDFVYAIHDAQGGMKCSDVIAHNPEDRSREENAFLASLEKKLFYSEEQVSLMKQYINAGIDYNKKVARLKAGSDEVENYKMIVILMSYQDVAFTTPREEVENLFNQIGYSKNGHPGSVHDFFVASSAGKLNLTATVVGPYISDSVQSYYGKQEGETHDLHVRNLIREAVQKADDDVDFSEYTNGDPSGYVSCVYVLYAGYSQAANINYPDLIWPHRSVIYPPIVLDEVRIQDYGCSSEFSGTVGRNQPMKIGTICHEFSHVLGQPDYYDTNYELQGNAFHPGSWDLMAGGNYNGSEAFPPLWHAMERTVRNYVTVEDAELNNDYTLEDLSKGAKALRLRYKGIPNEYFLLENRQRSGFDTYLEGHGLLIYKIDRDVPGWDYNCSNCDTSRLGFELITADGAQHTYSYWSGGFSYGQSQPFPGSTNNRSFTDNSNPSSKSHYGASLGLPLYRITENPETQNITFHIGDTTNCVNIYDAKVDYAMDTVKVTALMSVYSQTVTERGVLFSQEDTPTENNSQKQTDNSPSSVEISANLTTLSPNTTYYVRPYAKTTGNVSLGEIIRIKTPCSSINSFPYEEKFESGITDCWSEENDIYVANRWKVTDNGNAYINTDYTWTTSQPRPQPVMKLITPPVNTTILDQPVLIFKHHQKTIDSRTDDLNVYYRTSMNAPWSLLKSFKTQISDWQTDTIELPVKSQTIYIGFEAALRAGNGVYLDDVVITDKNVASWPVVNITTVKNITDNGATFKGSVPFSGYTPLIDKGFVISTDPNPTLDDMVISANDTTTGVYELTTDMLEPSTLYYVRAYAQNQGMTSYSSQRNFITQCAKIKDFPYTPDLSSMDTICFDTQDKLILPILDFSYKDSMAVIYTAQKNTLDDGTHNIEVYYRNGIDGEWEILNTTTNPGNQTITVNIPTANHQSENAYIGLSCVGLSSGEYLLKNITIKAVSQIAFVSTDSVALPEYNKIYAQGAVSYEGMAPVSERGFVYSKQINPTIADKKISAGNGIGSFSAVINDAEPLTTYYIRAFATNSYGTAYGPTLTINTPYIPIFNNTVSGDQHLCAGSVPNQINGSLPTGGNGEYTYLWISSSDGITWDSCAEGSVNDNQWYEPRQLFKTTYYRRVVTSYVSVDTSDVVTITIDPASKGGNVFAKQTEVRQNEEALFQLRAYVGQILHWERLRPGYDWVAVDNTADMEYFTDKPEDLGEYAYRAVVKSGVCNADISGEDKVNVVKGVGFEDMTNDKQISVSPNPSNGTAYLNLSGEYAGKSVRVVAADSKGNKVFSKEILSSSEKNPLNFGDIPNGTYILTIEGENLHKNLKLIIIR